jgi:tetratricopeptide (TPR) repeat protein
LGIVEPAILGLNEAGIQPAPELLRLGIELAGQLGEAKRQDEWLEQASSLKTNAPKSQAMLWYRQVERLITKGAIDKAEPILRRAEATCRTLNDERHIAVTMGKIADNYQSRGELDEALRINEEERLPVHTKLQDADGTIHVLWSNAHIRIKKGMRHRECKEWLRSLHRQAVLFRRIREAAGGATQ